MEDDEDGVKDDFAEEVVFIWGAGFREEDVADKDDDEEEEEEESCLRGVPRFQLFQSLDTLCEKSTLILRSSMMTLFILKYARSHCSFVSNSMKAYCKLCSVFLSRMTSHLRMVPKRENAISRSSSLVMGLSLQTNNTFSGGFASASGKSPSICRTMARERNSFSRMA